MPKVESVSYFTLEGTTTIPKSRGAGAKRGQSRPAGERKRLAKHIARLYLRRVRRQDEIAAIESFIASRGATRVPTAYVAEVAGAMPRADEVARLSRLKIKLPTSREFWQAILGRAAWPL